MSITSKSFQCGKLAFIVLVNSQKSDFFVHAACPVCKKAFFLPGSYWKSEELMIKLGATVIDHLRESHHMKC